MANIATDNGKGILGDILHAFPKLMPLILSHHPDCDPYRSDVIKIGKLRLCRGCTIAYGLVMIILATYILLSDFRNIFDLLSPGIIMGLGLFFGLFQILRVIFRKMGAILKSLVKVALGFGIALILIGLFRFDLGFTVTFFLIMGFFVLYGLFGGAIRYFYMKRTCEECVFHGDFKNCEGMKFLKELE